MVENKNFIAWQDISQAGRNLSEFLKAINPTSATRVQSAILDSQVNGHPDFSLLPPDAQPLIRAALKCRLFSPTLEKSTILALEEDTDNKTGEQPCQKEVKEALERYTGYKIEPDTTLRRAVSLVS